jgi:(E)-4-hydroxy-3-methyl-but-2-enyl pyrophosphate reductase
VDRAVDYAYQARTRFPDRTVYLTGEIIHNPHVNDQLRSLGIRFLSDPGESASRLGPEHVVILPAFGVTIATLQDLSARGCTLVDTTCGSVLNVWKNVKRYAQEGFTSVIHGKYWHEETEATHLRRFSIRADTTSSSTITRRRAMRAITSGTGATAASSSPGSGRRRRPGSIPTCTSSE